MDIGGPVDVDYKGATNGCLNFAMWKAFGVLLLKPRKHYKPNNKTKTMKKLI